jgi:hypothetical protein
MESSFNQSEDSSLSINQFNPKGSKYLKKSSQRSLDWLIASLSRVNPCHWIASSRSIKKMFCTCRWFLFIMFSLDPCGTVSWPSELQYSFYQQKEGKTVTWNPSRRKCVLQIECVSEAVEADCVSRTLVFETESVRTPMSRVYESGGLKRWTVPTRPKDHDSPNLGSRLR